MLLPEDTGSLTGIGRRRVLGQLGLTALGSLCAPGWLKGQMMAGGTVHPHLFWREDTVANLRTIRSVKKTISRSGLSRKIWDKIEAECRKERGTAPLTCRSRIQGRAESAALQNNPDYTICRAAGQRILRHALALHITGEEAYKAVAMKQLEALFDPGVWPDWIDQAHLRFNLPADLRTGMLSQDVGIAYDWLYPFLDDTERSFIIEGLERRGIRPYLESMNRDPWWSHDLNNWYTVIIGGLGIAGMALGKDHPEAGRLVEMSLPKMRRYLSIYGEDGSFNESVAYSNATRIPVAYFHAYYYHTAGEENPLAGHPFPKSAEWTIYATLAPDRWACFGDGEAERPVLVAYMAAIAAAIRNPVIQDYAVRHIGVGTNPYAFLWLDESLDGCSPEGKLPLGKAFNDNSALIFSRTSWDPDHPGMIVYGKTKQAANHGHNDLGQLCIDLDGKRMITDPGSPSSYPPDFFDEARFEYYNASVLGHNVLMFGGREQRYPVKERGALESPDLSAVNGRIIKAGFEEKRGGFWQLDLTPAYTGVQHVRRTVIHLFPGWVAVLDEAELIAPESISLRWHTFEPAEPDSDGNFRIVRDSTCLDCRVESLSGAQQSLGMKRHFYKPPYNMDRMGDPLEQRREPYVELILEDSGCRILSLFSMSEPDAPSAWVKEGKTGSWKGGSAGVEVTCNEKLLSLRDTLCGNGFEVAL